MATNTKVTRSTAMSTTGASRAILSLGTDGMWTLGFTDGAPGRPWRTVKSYTSLAAAKRGVEAWIGMHYKGCQWIDE